MSGRDELENRARAAALEVEVALERVRELERADVNARVRLKTIGLKLERARESLHGAHLARNLCEVQLVSVRGDSWPLPGAD